MANRASEWAERASGAFSGLKDRFSSRRDDGYDEGYDDYGYNDDYGEYGYDPDEEEDYETSSTGPVSTRSVGAGSGYTPSYTSTYQSNPRLVSMNEARSSVTARNNAVDPDTRVPFYRQNSTTSGYRSTGSSTEAGRSRGYDSLFTSTSGSSTARSTTATTASAAAVPDPKLPVYQIPLTKAPDDRSLEVVRPKEYGDVADVASILKRGDAVVLSLKMAPSAISTRVLDFAFGVASALDANVECIGDKVFFVVRGKGVSDGEREKLRLQGVVQ